MVIGRLVRFGCGLLVAMFKETKGKELGSESSSSSILVFLLSSVRDEMGVG